MDHPVHFRSAAAVVAVAASLLWSPEVRAQDPFPFVPMQEALFATPGALVNAWADVDGDGRPDLFVGFNGNVPNRLYLNRHGGRADHRAVLPASAFVEDAAAAGLADTLRTRSAAWGDVDGDGDPDLLLGFVADAGPVTRLYRNDGGRFVDVTGASGLAFDGGATRQFAFVDVDGDGDLDAFLAFRDRPNRLLLNDGDGVFTDGTEAAGLGDHRPTVGAVWLDHDGDGDLDLYVANMDGHPNGLYRNDGGRFTDVAEAAGVAWGGRAPQDPSNGTVRPCAADVDGDGLLDLFAANYGPNGLFLNRGDGTFRDASAEWGVDEDARWDACAFADVDHDGDLDLFVNGTVTGGVQYPDRLYRNEGRRFVDATPPALAALRADHGVQWADADGDGDLDLALAGAEAEGGTHALLRNDAFRGAGEGLRDRGPTDPGSLFVRVLDGRGRATRAGAEVRVYAAGSDRLLGTRLVDTGSGYDSQSDLPVHVGLGGVEVVDVEVVFPAGGRRIVEGVEGVRPGELSGRLLEVRVEG